MKPKLEGLRLRPVKLKGGSYIDYYSPSESRATPVQFHGRVVYVSDPLTYGNSKLGGNIAIFDLLSGRTCPNCRQCYADCYARASERQYSATFNRRLLQSYEASHDLPHLEARIRAQLARERPAIVRIHSSGDFFSQEYADMWSRLIAEFPGTQFYAYTKSPFRPAPASNLNIVESIVDGLPNFGIYEDVLIRAKKAGAPVCPYRTKQWCRNRGVEHKPVHCGTECRVCMHEAKVFFVQH